MTGGSRDPGFPAIAGVAVLAGALFALLFGFRRAGPLDFWWWMALNVCLVAASCLVVDKAYPARLKADLTTGLALKAGLGLAAAGLLYAIFAVGRLAALKMFPFAASGIASVYGLKSGAGTARIALLLALLIGPGEEIIWRGFLQENLGRKIGRGAGLASAALIYTLVHVASGNLMLIFAAGVCGLFWGLTYLVFRSTVLNAVSHAAWALVIFVVRPL